jgi:hypothetical protein
MAVSGNYGNLLRYLYISRMAVPAAASVCMDTTSFPALEMADLLFLRNSGRRPDRFGVRL